MLWNSKEVHLKDSKILDLSKNHSNNIINKNEDFFLIK